MSEQSHRSDPRILNRRTLERDHRRLLDLLRPGMAVLDVGCGTGAITAGIARVAGSNGAVTGVDRDETLLEIARNQYRSIPNLRFEKHDARSLPFESCFDVANAARMLQWVSRPGEVIASMKKALKPCGRLVALDYNHEDNSWKPQPPSEFRRFYDAFLAWRKLNEWDNRMADHLPGLFRSEGLESVESFPDDQIASRVDPDFPNASVLWIEVIQSVGPQIVTDGFLREQERSDAECQYRDWAENRLKEQVLCMRTVIGWGRP
jgi:ubiquinone/menaquinone biosynthesis C-methylase UbiE